MNDEQWGEVIERLTANWPHQLPPEVALVKWRRDLDDLEALHVHAAIEAHYREGREFPPNGAQIRAKIAELARAAVDHGAAYELAMRAAAKCGHVAGLDWLEHQDPAVAEAARRYPWREFCLEASEDTTRRAQFRDVYQAVLREQKRNDAYVGLTGTGLERLEQANNGPRRLGAVVEKQIEGGTR